MDVGDGERDQVLLDAPGEVIRAREGELPADEIERQLEGYRALVRALPNGHVVDAAQSPENTAADTSAIVLAFMAERTASRLAKRAPRAR